MSQKNKTGNLLKEKELPLQRNFKTHQLWMMVRRIVQKY